MLDLEMGAGAAYVRETRHAEGSTTWEDFGALVRDPHIAGIFV
jgi:hypothetical protein